MQRHPMPWILLAIVASALLAIAGAYGIGGRNLHYACKPLTTALVLLLALRAPRAGPPRVRQGVVAGLVLSLAGDVWLMLPGDYFVAGLASFLLAHLCYLVAFSAEARLGARSGPFVVYAVVATSMLAVLWSRLPAGLHAPVTVYVVVLAVMAAQATARAQVVATPAARLAAVGAGCFVLSDASLAFDRFHTPFPAAIALVLATYWLAQGLIAASLWTRLTGPDRAS